MTSSVAPGPASSPDDARATREFRRLLREELPRVRAAAVDWRNGLVGLLTALVAFSLIRGRSDISQLAGPWDVLVGILLLVALLAGACAALSLIRAANGTPAMTSVTRLWPAGMADHLEAKAAVRALRRGIVMSLGCAALLVAAVGITWYGPPKDAPPLQIVSPGMTICGQVIRLGSEMISIGTEAGEVSVELNQIRSIRPLESCP
jgi:peptidoglycan/LPS O-acetylase OafA/YrhL